jgi:hypothetical protein
MVEALIFLSLVSDVFLDHSHFEWLKPKLSYSSIRILLEVCLSAHDLEFPGWTAANVN